MSNSYLTAKEQHRAPNNVLRQVDTRHLRESNSLEHGGFGYLERNPVPGPRGK